MATYLENSLPFGLRYGINLIVNLVFPISVFWSGNLFLFAPFLDLCLLGPFCYLKKFPSNHGEVSVMRIRKLC